MSLRVIRHLVAAVIVLGSTQVLFAGHNSGINITYDCLGGNDYLITVNLFRDCSDPELSPDELNGYIYSTCEAIGYVDFPRVSEQEVSQLCAAELPNSTCNGGTQPGVLLSIYQLQVSMPPCVDWRMVIAQQNRTLSLNLFEPQLNPIHVEAFLNNADGACNDAPVLGVLNLPFICAGSPLFYNLSFSENDGDSLVYSLVPALTSLAPNAPYEMDYIGGYTGAAPIPGISIDPSTGQIALTPTMQGLFNVVVQVEEFRGGLLIGTVRQDFLFQVYPCATPPPVPVAGSLTHVSGGAYPTGDLNMGICPGDDFCFSLEVASADPAISITLSANIAANIPGATATFTGSNPVTAEFCGSVPPDFSGVDFLVTAIDNACSIYGQAYFSISLSARPPLTASPAQVLCKGETVSLFAENDTTYTWTDENGDFISPSAGFSCNPCSNPVIVADSSTTFTVTGLYDGGSCDFSRVVEIDVPLELDNVVNPETCTGGDGSILLTILTGSGMYDVSWSDLPTNEVSRTGLEADTYEVTISDQVYGCSRTEIYIVDELMAPVADAGADGFTCDGSATLDALPSFGVGTWTSLGAVQFSDTTDSDAVLSASSAGTYTLIWTENAGNGCVDSDTVQFEFLSRPEIENPIFSCTGIDALFELNFDAEGGDTANYQVTGIDGAWLGTSFFSDPLPSETLVEILLSDGGLCGSDTLGGTIFCESLSASGAMPSDTLRICGSDEATVENMGTVVLEANDALIYVLHSLPGNVLGTVAATSADPIFSFAPGLLPETVYYLSAVVGNAIGNGVDTADPFLSVAPGTPVIFYVRPEVSLSGNEVRCVGESVEFEMEIMGALPQILEFSQGGALGELAVFENPAVLNAPDSGTYVLVSTASQYCTGTVSGAAVLTWLARPEAGIDLSPTVCAGDTALMELSFTGAAPFAFSLLQNGVLVNSFSSSEMDFTIPLSLEGSYSIAGLTDAQCPAIDTLQRYLEVLPLPIANAGADLSICSGDTVQLGIAAINGQSYQWDGAAGLLSDAGAMPLFAGLNEGINVYQVAVFLTAALQGCTSRDTVIVEINSLPLPQIIGAGEICAGDTVSYFGYGADGVTWAPAGLFLSPGTAQSGFSAFANTEITLSLTSLAGCKAETSQLVEVHPTPNAVFVPSAAEGCAPLEVVFTVDETPSGQQYFWNSGIGTATSTSPQFSEVYSLRGAFRPSLTIENSFGCSAVYQLPDPIDVYDAEAAFSFSPNEPDITDPQVFFTNQSTSGTSAYWTFDSLATSTEWQSSFVFPGVAGARYAVCLSVISPQGCIDEVCEIIEVKDDFYIYMPTAFTPDGDGLNDLFGPVLTGIDPVEYHFWITNRQGQVVFDTHNPHQKWDGGSRGSGYFEGNGMYVWNLLARPDFDLGIRSYSGKVMMLR